MALFRRRTTYDRARILEAAARARARGKRRRAIDLYRQVLFVEPRNGDLHAKLAPLLADTCLLYTSPSPRDLSTSRMPSSA